MRGADTRLTGFVTDPIQGAVEPDGGAGEVAGPRDKEGTVPQEGGRTESKPEQHVPGGEGGLSLQT